MTWSKFDDAAAKSPKAMVAGNEAWSLWSAAIMYCNRHLTDGYVSLAALATECLPVPIPLAKAKKLAEQLCDARARPEGAGLFEPAGNQLWKVHDFEDWNPSKAEVEAKRKADRDRKRRGPDSGGESGGSSGTIPRGIPNGKRPDSEPHAGVRARVARPDQPGPSRPTTSPGVAAAEPIEDRSSSVPCPPDLDKRLIALGVHRELAEKLGVDPQIIVAELRAFTETWVVGAYAGQSRPHWAKKARQWVVNQKKQGLLSAKAAPEEPEELGAPAEVRAKLAKLREGIG